MMGVLRRLRTAPNAARPPAGPPRDDPLRGTHAANRGGSVRPPPGAEHMRLLLSSLNSPADLPPEVERLLCEVIEDGFMLYCCGPGTRRTRWPRRTSGSSSSISLPSGASTGSWRRGSRNGDGWTYSRPRLSCGPTRVLQSTPFGRCSTWYTRSIPARPAPSTPRRRPCTFHDTSSARRRSDSPRLAGPGCVRLGWPGRGAPTWLRCSGARPRPTSNDGR
jgi:hypothetical protein